jgi:hypothetical protein
MASILKSKFALGLYQMPAPQGAEIVHVTMEYPLAGALVVDDIIWMGDLPEDCVPVDAVLDVDDLDSGGSPAITLSLGILTAARTAIDTGATSGGAAWITSATTGQAGGMVRPTTNALWRTTARTSTPSGSTPAAAQLRSVGVHVAVAPATGATTGRVRVHLSYRAAQYGV